MTYQEYTKAKENAFNQLPLFWAFSSEQFDEALAERGLERSQAKEKVYSLGSGCFCLKSDMAVVNSFFERDPYKELHDMLEADIDFAREAFEYEMFNHEYPINWQGDWDVCSVFGKVEYDEDKCGREYLEELGFSKNVIVAYYEVRKKVCAADCW